MLERWIRGRQIKLYEKIEDHLYEIAEQLLYLNKNIEELQKIIKGK